MKSSRILLCVLWVTQTIVVQARALRWRSKFLSYTHMCPQFSLAADFYSLTLCARHQWSVAGGPRWFPGAPGDRSFQELWQNSLKYQTCTASSGLLLIESGHELMMGVFGLPASLLSLPLLSPAPYPSWSSNSRKLYPFSSSKHLVSPANRFSGSLSCRAQTLELWQHSETEEVLKLSFG